MVSVESRIEQVTVYASGARVRRVATVAARPVVRFVGLPLAVLDETVRVEITGGAIATAVRTTVAAPEPAVAAREESAELRAARRHVALAEAELQRLDAALAAEASVVELDPSDDPPAPWSAIVAARRGLVALRTERELHLHDQRAKARHEATEATETLAAITDRELRLGNARAPKLHELRKQIELELAGTGELEIHVEYQVAAARWAPTYVARLEGDQVRVELRAVVAQDSGEDWLGVAMRLSTAEPARFATLPELAAQKIGRKQAVPARAGFRAPPAGADQLYADYQRAFPLAPHQLIQGDLDDALIRGEEDFEDDTFDGVAPATALSREVWDEESSRAKRAFETPPRGSPVPMPQLQQQAQMPVAPAQFMQAPMGQMKSRGSRPRTERYLGAAPGGGGMAPPPPPPPPIPRLDYASLRIAPPSSQSHGQLIAIARDAGPSSDEGASRLASLALPRGCSAAWAHTFDYAFASDGNVEVRADGAWHNLALTSRTTTAKLGHVSVPREQADVFRVAAIPNPFVGPLLPGPIDIYDRGQFLLTSTVDYTPPGATVDVGLGVDAAVKVARNAEFREEIGGMLRGALRLVHAIAIDVENLSGRAIDVEIRERVPVTREGEDDIEVTLGKIEPAWERWTPDPDAPKDQRLRGAHRWRLALPAGARRTLRAGYEVKIASKHELVGGNRREP